VSDPSQRPDFVPPVAPAQPSPSQPSPSYPAHSYPAPAYPGQSYPGQSYPGQSYPAPTEAAPVPQATFPGVPTDLGAPAVTVPEAPERVGRGLLFASLGVLAGVVLTVVIWRLGFVASLTSLLLAVGAGWLYVKGAGAPPRKGLVPLLLLIVAGVVVALLVAVASDIWVAYLNAFPDADTTELVQAVQFYLFDGETWSDSGVVRSVIMFVLFAALGMFSIVRQLLSGRKR
jgi:hypothetical protein